MNKPKQKKMKTKMTKKIKICIAAITLVVIILGLLLASLLIKTSYCMPISAPDTIVVHYNDSSNNIVFEKGDKNYNKIYEQLSKSYKKSIFTAFIKGELNKDPKISASDIEELDYSGINIAFVYDSPQIVKTKSGTYTRNGEVYWYQTLVFNIVENDRYQYNSIAIIPPYDSNDYISPAHYTLTCKAYSNFSKLYGTANKLFN